MRARSSNSKEIICDWFVGVFACPSRLISVQQTFPQTAELHVFQGDVFSLLMIIEAAYKINEAEF